MTGPRRGRGRLDNGLDAALWAPVRDVDPRVGEHLLDVLREAGIAAYLEPAADVEPYTRTVTYPSPPVDRLFVDRARVGEGRALVDRHADDHAPAEAVRRPARRDLDEDVEWARIVAAYEAEHGRTVVEDAPPPHDPPQVEQAEREEHYEPPPAPPVPLPSPSTLYAVLLAAAGVVLVGAPRVLGLTTDTGLVLGVAALVGSAGLFLSRMRERSTDDGDDGAVV
ncbi:hypothetical protein SAMN05660464_2862 [Geodermatophilus dictyosporus]|uniref:DUF308 domain-containing protein n=1 Tax=Geodermatophilus dictyosporus TaxID=1523247 RepID=A0A1I5PLA1_9ACTN|nr:hypothetical protein [Geodermatophilus dictyosporus]SFP34306.1 hypothetical protein SAMN05660464_2862 [Geodermatophilus dictyosporus]